MRLLIYQHFLQLGDKSRRIPGSSSHQICNGLTSGILSEPYRTFDICVRWPSGSDYESVKADLTRQLVAHFKS